MRITHAIKTGWAAAKADLANNPKQITEYVLHYGGEELCDIQVRSFESVEQMATFLTADKKRELILAEKVITKTKTVNLTREFVKLINA